MSDQKLPKRERLKFNKDFKRAFEKGKRIIDTYFVIIYFENNLRYSRIATVVRKDFGKAFQRNKIKRYIREIYRTNKIFFPKGYDFVFIPRKFLSDNFCKVSYSELREMILSMVKRMTKNEEVCS